MRVVTLKKEDSSKGSLILVNRMHPMRGLVRKNDLQSVGNGVLLQKEAALQLKLLLREAKGVTSVSGFRSRKEQEQLYSQSLAENGQEFTGKYVALPGRSEHESGLAIDLGEAKEEIDFICPDFPYHGICQEVRQKAPYLGFIQRYEEEKEEITGISCEPWHFRYVGFPHSLIMAERKLSLEEYLELLKKEKRIFWQCGSRNVEIRYIDASEEEIEITDIPRDRPYQISGDNAGGFVVTVF